MKEYQIIDNFLEENDFYFIRDHIIYNKSFPWFLNHSATSENSNDGLCFGHSFHIESKINSNFWELLIPLFEKIVHKTIIRTKVNLYLKTEKIHQHEFHVDERYPHNGFLYYLNTNNGYTILNDGTKIESISNRALFFDSSLEHASTTCSDKDFRANININYF